MIGLLCLAFGLVGQSLLGMFIAAVVLSFRDRSKLPLVELMGLGCALGVGVTAWSLFVWSLCDGPLGLLPSGLLAACGYVTGGPLFVRRLQYPRAERKSAAAESSWQRQENAVCRLCQAAIAILFVGCLLRTLQTPQKLWDERAIFALKARVLFEDGSIRSPALLHPDFVQYHPRYPLLLPLAEENVYALLGHVDDRLAKLVFVLLYCGLVLTAAGVLRRHISRGQAWLGTLVLATVPVMMPYEYGFICGQADAPVACFHGLSVLYLWDGMRRQRGGDFSLGPLSMAGICAGMTVFTKDEGIAFLAVDASIIGLFTLVSLRKFDAFRQLLQATLVFVVTAAAVVVPWFLHRRGLPLTTEMNYVGRMTVSLFVSRLDTLNWSVPHLLRRMFWEFREWGLQWWLMIATFVSNPARAIEPPQLLFILDITGALVSLLVAGMLAPAQLDEHIGGSSHRFLMQIAPVAVLFAVTQFASIPKSPNSIASASG